MTSDNDNPRPVHLALREIVRDQIGHVPSLRMNGKNVKPVTAEQLASMLLLAFALGSASK